MRKNNLLLDNAAAPGDGLTSIGAIQWYGGPLKLKATGTFAGASVTVAMNTRCPTGGDPDSYSDLDLHPEIEWVDIHTFTAAGTFDVDNLNPCALCIRGADIDADDTRVKVVVTVG